MIDYLYPESTMAPETSNSLSSSKTCRVVSTQLTRVRLCLIDCPDPYFCAFANRPPTATSAPSTNKIVAAVMSFAKSEPPKTMTTFATKTIVA